MPNNNQHPTLSELSEKNKPWDRHKADSEKIAIIYENSEQFKRYAQRIDNCAGRLTFQEDADIESGSIGLKLKEVFFCRVRSCPICQWRRSLMWKARFYQALSDLVLEYPKSRWLFVTFTVKNCDVKDIRSTIQTMNTSWTRLVKKIVFKDVIGWVRTIEVTRHKFDSHNPDVKNSHPHFHCLLMVKPSYFGGSNYISTEAWGKAWQEAARLDYKPQVKIKAVRLDGKIVTTANVENMRSAVAETLKYSVKPSDAIGGEAEAAQWFLELTKRVHQLRFIASGGALKNVFKNVKAKDNLIPADEEQKKIADGKEYINVSFNWNSRKKVYRRT